MKTDHSKSSERASAPKKKRVSSSDHLPSMDHLPSIEENQTTGFGGSSTELPGKSELKHNESNTASRETQGAGIPKLFLDRGIEEDEGPDLRPDERMD